MPQRPISGSDRTTTTCAHCGDPCSTEILDGDEAFCCAGCRSVYVLLRDHDLCTYYDLGSNPGISMKKGAVRTDMEALDDPAIFRTFVEYSDLRFVRVRFTIPAMHCASCVWLLERLSSFDAGILHTETDVLRKTVRVDFDPAVTTLRSVAELLSSLGYEPLVKPVATATDGRERRAIYQRLGVAGFATGNVMLFGIARYLAGDGLSSSLTTMFSIFAVLLSIPVLVYSAAPWLRSAWAAIGRRALNLDVPVAIGILVLFFRSVADIVTGHGEGFLDSFNGLVFLLLVGRLFQQKAFDAVSFDRTYRSFFPLSVRVERNGSTPAVPVDDVVVGDVMVVRNGETIPCDGTVLSPVGYLDYGFVTGESLPIECTSGAAVFAGGKVVGTAIRIAATNIVSHGYLASLWERATPRIRISSLLTLSDTFGRWFTVVAMLLAAGGAIAQMPDVHMAVNVLTAVLIIACPCALTLAAPVTLGTAMGRLGERGIYLRSVGVLLDLDRCSTIVFDKTGTLTKSMHGLSYDGRSLADHEWMAVRSVAAQSMHPVSRSLAQAWPVDETVCATAHEVAGRGMTGRAYGHDVVIGSSTLVEEMCPDGRVDDTTDGAAHIAVDGAYAGSIRLRSELREGISEMMGRLRERRSVRLLSGDGPRDRAMLLSMFDDDEMSFGRQPADKVGHIDALRASGHTVLMIGDGLNDAAAMSAADTAIAVTDDTATLVPACDVIMNASALGELPALLRYARRMKNLIIATFCVSVVYNAVGLSLALGGMLTPLAAAILMPVSSLTVIGMSVAGARWYARSSVWTS